MADRNFDEEFEYDKQEGHSFTLGGYTFRTPPVAPPGAFLDSGRGLFAAVRFLRRLVLPEDRANLERVLEMSDSSAILLDLAPELLSAAAFVLACEEGDDETARKKALDEMQKLVEQAMQPAEPGPLISAHEVDEAARWLMETTIGRPTTSPSPSGNGDGRTSRGSKVASSKAAKAGKP